jgi:hypothetical protein
MRDWSHTAHASQGVVRSSSTLASLGTIGRVGQAIEQAASPARRGILIAVVLLWYPRPTAAMDGVCNAAPRLARAWDCNRATLLTEKATLAIKSSKSSAPRSSTTCPSLRFALAPWLDASDTHFCRPRGLLQEGVNKIGS